MLDSVNNWDAQQVLHGVSINWLGNPLRQSMKRHQPLEDGRGHYWRGELLLISLRLRRNFIILVLKSSAPSSVTFSVKFLPPNFQNMISRIALLLTITSMRSLAMTESESLAEQQQQQLTAQCRSTCVSKYHEDGSSRTCFEHNECWMCWDVCSMLYSKPQVWSVMCDESNKNNICFSGCQQSCEFHARHAIDEASNGEETKEMLKGHFEESSIVISAVNNVSPSQHYNITWNRPICLTDDCNIPFVYAVLVKQFLNDVWQEIEQTVNTNLTVTSSLLKSSSLIKIVAYDPNGRFANVQEDLTQFGFGSWSSTDDSLLFKDQAFSRNSSNVIDGSDSWATSLDSIGYSLTVKTGLEAHVSWPSVIQAMDLSSENMFEDTDVSAEVSVDRHTVVYEIVYKHVDASSSYEVTSAVTTFDEDIMLTLWPDQIYQLRVLARVNLCSSTSSCRTFIIQAKPITITTHLQHLNSSNLPTNLLSFFLKPQVICSFILALFTVIMILVFIKISTMNPKTNLKDSVTSEPSFKSQVKTSTPVRPSNHCAIFVDSGYE